MPIIKYSGGCEEHYLEHPASFADSCIFLPHVKASLGSCAHNLAQAKILTGQPLGLFACFTGEEEEAAAFLYHCLKAKGYHPPKFGKFRDHGDKARMMIQAVIMEDYFFEHFEAFGEKSFLKVVNKDGKVFINNSLVFGDYAINMVSILQIVASTDGIDDGPKKMMDASIERALSHFGSSSSVSKTIEKMKNRRNLCLCGATCNKPKLTGEDEWKHYKLRCELIITLGFLLLRDDEKSAVLQDLCNAAAAATMDPRSSQEIPRTTEKRRNRMEFANP